jgi:3-deoxy-7-phosphoheptulonate synthase
MLVVMRQGASEEAVRRVMDVIRDMGYEARPIPGRNRTAIGLVGNDGRVDSGRIEVLPEVLQIIHVTQPYKQVSREWRQEPTVVELPNGSRIGGNEVVLIAGPCAVESESQILEIAHFLREAGASALRGGAFKPRTSPYAFQGLGVKGLELLARAREETGLAVVTEVLEPDRVDVVAEHADVLQIGARNMQNYPLLRRAGRTGKPVLLKRGLAATIKELLLSAEYLLAEGNANVILCERGIRGFDDQTRNVFDLTAVPVVQALSHLPIVADPSHGTGIRNKVIPMARAAVAAGADGVLIEVHPTPDTALSDGGQSLHPQQFTELVRQVGLIAEAIGRSLGRRSARSAAVESTGDVQ